MCVQRIFKSTADNKDIAYDYNLKIISKALNIDSEHSEAIINNGVTPSKVVHEEDFDFDVNEGVIA